MLTTETYSLDAGIEELTDRIEDLADQAEDLDESSEQYQSLTARQERLKYLRTGLQWQRDEEDWGDAELEFGALTAGEEAIMHRAMPDSPNRKEQRLWFVAAATVDAPFSEGRDADDPLTESFVDTNFTAIAGAGIHGGFVQWAEAKANSLGVPGAQGNGTSSSTSSKASDQSPTSTSEPPSTTTSSSASPTE